jgi:hypothetical protein
MKITSFGDLTKAAGGKLNLNSLLGVNMMMLLGAYRFCVGNAAYQSLARSSEYKWEEQKRLLGERRYVRNIVLPIAPHPW